MQNSAKIPLPGPENPVENLQYKRTPNYGGWSERRTVKKKTKKLEGRERAGTDVH